jgi:hypothetical protein
MSVRCKDCNRILSASVSQTKGYGVTCARKAGVEYTLEELSAYTEEMEECRRITKERVESAVRDQSKEIKRTFKALTVKQKKMIKDSLIALRVVDSEMKEIINVPNKKGAVMRSVQRMVRAIKSFASKCTKEKAVILLALAATLLTIFELAFLH